MTAAADRDRGKQEAARRALEFVKPGMKLGLGTGTTARHFVDCVGERVKAGLDVRCVATSEATETQAKGLGIPLSTLDELLELDLTVDGADEIDPKLRLIKGGGGALLREKIVAAASKRMIVIADSTKLVAGSAPFRCRSRSFLLALRQRGGISNAPSPGSASRGRSACAEAPRRSSLTEDTISSTARFKPSPSPNSWPRPCR